MIGEWLRGLREGVGMSQKAAAEATGLPERSIRRWESGEIPNGLNLLELLSAYGVTMTPAAPVTSRVDEVVARFEERLTAAAERLVAAREEDVAGYHREVQKLRRELERARAKPAAAPVRRAAKGSA